MRTQFGDFLNSLQRNLLEHGGRLPILDVPQKLDEIGDNNIEGKAYAQPQTHEGEQLTMSTTTEDTNKNKGSVREVPPAGGRTGAEVADALIATLERAQRALDNDHMRTSGYGRKALDAAVPTAIAVAGIVTLYAGVTFVSNRWGRNSLVNRELALIESGKLRMLNADTAVPTPAM